MLSQLFLILALLSTQSKGPKSEVSSFKAKYESNGKYKLSSVVLFSPVHEMVLSYAGADAKEPVYIQYYNKKEHYFVQAVRNGGGYEVKDSRKILALINLKEYKLTDKTQVLSNVTCTLLESENNLYGSVWVDLNTKLSTKTYFLNSGIFFPYGLVPTYGDTKYLTELEKEVNIDAEVEQMQKKYFTDVPVVQ